MVKILALLANPSGTALLRLHEEIRRIEESFENNGVDIQIKVVGAVRKEDLQTLLIRYSPEIVHFSAHGNEYGELYFENGTGEISLMTSTALESIFSKFKHMVKAVVLNACYSEVQAEAISKHIPYVIGMSNPIIDNSSIIFSTMLYTSLALGDTIVRAFELAKNEVLIHNSEDNPEPLFFLNNSLSLNARISFTPTICAEFIIKNGKPYIKKGLYLFKVYVRNYPKDIKKVLYQWDEDEIYFEEQFDERNSSLDHFSTSDLAVYGDIIIRVILWSTKDKGTGYTTTLKEALKEHYGNTSDPEIVKAIQEIEDN